MEKGEGAGEHLPCGWKTSAKYNFTLKSLKIHLQHILPYQMRTMKPDRRHFL